MPYKLYFFKDGKRSSEFVVNVQLDMGSTAANNQSISKINDYLTFTQEQNPNKYFITIKK